MKSLRTNNPRKLTYYTGCVFERDRDKEALQISQTARVYQLVDRLDIALTGPVPSHPSVRVRAKRKEEEACTERY